MSGPPAELLRSGDRQRPDLLQLPKGSPAREPRGPEVHQSRHWRSPDCHGPAARSREDRDASVDRGAVRGRRLRRVVSLDRRAPLTRRSHVILAGPDSADPDARADRLDSQATREHSCENAYPVRSTRNRLIAGSLTDLSKRYKHTSQSQQISGNQWHRNEFESIEAVLVWSISSDRTSVNPE